LVSLRSCLGSFFFQAEDGIRDLIVTGVQTCALPILRLQVGELTHLADREELLNGMGDAHRQCSGLSSRSIKSATAWLGDLRLKRSEERRVGKECGWRRAAVHHRESIA